MQTHKDFVVVVVKCFNVWFLGLRYIILVALHIGGHFLLFAL